MRRNGDGQPVWEQLTRQIRPLRTGDLEQDPRWAATDVSRRWESGTASYSQVHKFAEALGPPVVRWPLAIAKEGTLGLGNAGPACLREEDPGRLWGHFV